MNNLVTDRLVRLFVEATKSIDITDKEQREQLCSDYHYLLDALTLLETLVNATECEKIGELAIIKYKSDCLLSAEIKCFEEVKNAVNKFIKPDYTHRR